MSVRTGCCSVDDLEISDRMGRCEFTPANADGCASCWLADWIDETTERVFESGLEATREER